MAFHGPAGWPRDLEIGVKLPVLLGGHCARMKRRNKAHFPNVRDYVGEELIRALLEGETCTFQELFEKVNSGLQARTVKNVSEEMRHLRAYEKLRALVSEGAVRKVGNGFTGIRRPLQVIARQMMEARNARDRRRKREAAQF